VDDWSKDEDPTARRSFWLVTMPHPKSATSADGFPLRAPGDFTKQGLFEAVADSCDHPDYLNAKSSQQADAVSLNQAGVFKELHQPDPEGVTHTHAHVAAGTNQIRFLPVKRALLKRHGLASHWKPLDGYWAGIRYCWKPTDKKPLKSLDRQPFLWPKHHPPCDECCNEPMTAKAVLARRRYAEDRAAEEGKPEPKVKELDLYGVVVDKGFRNSDDDRTAHKQLIVHAMQKGSAGMRDLLWKQRARLPSIIDDIWAWHDMEVTLVQERMTRIEALKACASGTCVCGGVWLSTVLRGFMLNKIDVKGLCKDVLSLLTAGRSPSSPVLTLAGALGGEGKSIFLKAIINVIGQDQVFGSPVPGNFPMLGLLDSKVCFFDEWRFDQEVVPWAVQCLLYDGSGVTVNRPQNVAGQIGHTTYRGSSPIFVTTKLADVRRLEAAATADPTTGLPGDADALMIFRRLKIYPFTVRIPKPPPGLPYCARCFSSLVLSQGS